MDNWLESACATSEPPPGDVASCTWSTGGNYTIYAITPHEHLLGMSMTVTLDPGTPQQRVLLAEPFDFHYQRSYAVSPPVTVTSSDKIQVSCHYNPVLRSTLPYVKNLPPRYVLWADGSSDEMCLAIITAVATGARPMVATSTAPSFGGAAVNWPMLSGASATSARQRALLAQFRNHLALCGL
jgi:hypothetical protein